MTFIKGFIGQHGYSPSLREICDNCGISSTSIANQELSRLVQMGLLTRVSGKPRTLALVPQPLNSGIGNP